MAPGFVIARPRRGRGNLAVPCRISGKPRRKRDRLREIATSAVGLLAMTNLGAIAFLILARTSRRCSAGRGMPLPYNTACGRRWLVRAASAFPRLPRHFAPRNDTSGWCCGAPALSYGRMSLYKAVTTRKGHAASVRRQSRQRLRSDRRYTPYFGVYHFNGGRRYRVTFHFPLAHAMP